MARRSRTQNAYPPVEHDPLFVVFEQHLFNFQDADIDRKVFIGHVVYDYMEWLRKSNLVIPREFERLVIEELAAQVNVMLLKRIYGFVTIAEFQRGGVSEEDRRVAAETYQRLKSRAA